MSTYLMPNEVLTLGNETRCCMECGEQTMFYWLDCHPFCSLECLDSFAKEWLAEMECGIDEKTEYEQQLEERLGEDVPAWWPSYPNYVLEVDE